MFGPAQIFRILAVTLEGGGCRAIVSRRQAEKAAIFVQILGLASPPPCQGMDREKGQYALEKCRFGPERPNFKSEKMIFYLTTGDYDVIYGNSKCYCDK